MTSTFTPRVALKDPQYLGGEVSTFVMDFVQMNIILYAYIIVFYEMNGNFPYKIKGTAMDLELQRH